MLILSNRNQLIIGLLLTMMMVLTRSEHFATLQNLADASWVVFFLAGVYLRSAWPLLGFFALSWGLDFAAYTWGGVSDFCITPAYVFLLPAYASLWLAGRWYSKHYQFAWHTLLPLAASVMAGLVLCELFSSGGFYFFSGRFAETTLIEFGERLMRYFPFSAESFVFYIGIVSVIHWLLALIVQQFNSRNTTTG